jgi:hypothetical protein
MEVYYDIIGYVKKYMAVNELKKCIRREVILVKFLIYMLKNRKWNSPKHDYAMDLWKSGPL